ncbi:dynactin subunit 2-B-like [Paramacrobiotus metropolitanus]|uniref:dynactin subunit 2-B-like n=1 Tax=Paramacrobiotus metropolitanus TaxID=2943436 RepID=UPI0024457201|nr:dynactin subunit 2-B-like [Paramacrobiotus metropolitanus]
MAVVPKITDLPGIAHGEPDVYETEGTGERDNRQTAQYDMSENENIERTGLDAAQAYAQFKGKSVPVSATDFSESVARSRKHGYTAEKGLDLYEANGEGMLDETLQERFERIQRDVKALETDYEILSAQQKRDDSFLPSADADFAGQIAQLKVMMATLAEKQVRTPSKATRGKGASNPSDLDSKKSGADNRSAEDMPASALENRIKKLEQAFGTERELNVLATDSSNSLMATVTMLKNQMSLLDKDNLDQIESRMQQFLPRLNQAIDKLNPTHTSDEELDKKINEAYAMLKGWSGTIDRVQAVVDRLVALKAVHEQASTYVQIHDQVDKMQKQLFTKMADLEKSNEAAKESFSQIIGTITRDIEQLESRLKK